MYRVTFWPGPAATRLAKPLMDGPTPLPSKCQAVVPFFLFSAITQAASVPSGPAKVAGPVLSGATTLGLVLVLAPPDEWAARVRGPAEAAGVAAGPPHAVSTRAASTRAAVPT